MSGPANPKAAVHNVQMPKKLIDFLDKLSGPPKNDIGLIFDMFFSDQIACPKSLQLFGHLVPGTRRAFPNISDQLLEMCPMTRGQATPIVMCWSDICWSR